MRRILFGLLLLAACFNAPAAAQTADELVARYIKTIGGMEKIKAINSLRRSGKFIGGGGFEAVYVTESKRPNFVRQEFSLQGMTGINAYDGKNGWKIEPWQGKKDVETLSEDELKDIVEESDFDGPLIDYQKKGNKVEYAGKDEIEGSDVYKLKVTLANGDVRYFYLDTDYYVPIKIEIKRMIRGAEVELETTLGDYKAVNGVYFPFSFETGAKGSPNTGKIIFEKIEANASLDDTRFVAPKPALKPKN
jgi:hypothetical protein